MANGRQGPIQTGQRFRFVTSMTSGSHPNGTYSIFENGAADGELKPKARMSKAYIFRINQKEDHRPVKTHPPRQPAHRAGQHANSRRTATCFTGWGSLEYLHRVRPRRRGALGHGIRRCRYLPLLPVTLTGTRVPGAIGVKSETDTARTAGSG